MEVDSVSSSFLKGELQNLLARDEDLYGADLHLVNNKAFFGGVEQFEFETIALSTDSTLTLTLCSSSRVKLLFLLDSDLTESCLGLVGFFLRKKAHLGQTSRQRHGLGFLIHQWCVGVVEDLDELRLALT